MSIAMGSPFFNELKKQASFFLKDKIRTARLALTDVTPAELLTEEATNGNPWAPEARTMGFISRAAFEIDDYWRIVEILHKRLEKFDPRHWREPYKALVLLEHLLTHGPESVAEEFQSDRKVIEELGTFQFIDERGFNWGLTVRKKSERVLKLLEKGELLKEERDRARKVSRGIQGFGSFNQRWTPTERREAEQGSDWYGRSNSHYETFSEDMGSENYKENVKPDEGIVKAEMKLKAESGEKAGEEDRGGDGEARTLVVDESKPLLAREEKRIEFHEEHPFDNFEHQRMESTLLLNRA